MGKNSWRRRVDDDGEENDNNPSGSVWRRFVYALDYHHWNYNVKKKLHQRLLHDKNKNRLIHNDPAEAQRLLEDKQSHLQSPKKSLRARIKAFIVEQSQEAKNHKQHTKYQRTYSIHRLEPQDDDHDWKNPIFILPNKDSKEEATVKDKSHIPKMQLNEDKDVMELFKVNKNLFFKIIHDAEVGGGKFPNRKIRLTKSGSFPLHDSKRGNYKPLKLKDKQNEVWSGAKGDYYEAPNLAMPKYAKELLESLDLLAGEEDNRTLNRASTLDFRHKEIEQEKEEDTEVNMPVKEGKNDKSGNKFASILEVLDELQSSQTDMEIGSNSSTKESDGFGVPKSSFLHRRSSSLNESLNRYSRLYEHSCGKEIKLNPSKSLKVTNERVMPSIPFRRIRSLSNVNSSYFLQVELLDGAPFSDHPISTAEESNSLNEEKPESSKENNASVDEIQENDEVSPDTERLAEEADELKFVTGNSYEEQEIKCSEVASNDNIHSRLDSKFETSFQEEILTPSNYQFSKGLEDECDNAKEMDFAINSSSESFCTDFVSSQKSRNVEKTYKQSRADTMDDPNLCYVMDILESSGFTQNFFQGTSWYSNEQLINPSVFEEVEAFWHHEIQCCSREELCGCYYHHQMLFDLINEILVQIYDRSFPYYPLALSSSCKIRSLPTGKHIIEEVCSSISSFLNIKAEVKQSIDSIVGRDLGKDYGWMNLQLESEFVALELEGMFFDDLLDELLNL